MAMRFKTLLVLILPLLILACSAAHTDAPSEHSSTTRRSQHHPLARIPVTLLNESTSQPLGRYQGKLTVLFITSSRCRDCGKLHARLNKLKNRFPSQSIHFLALFLDDTSRVVRNILRLYPLSYQVFLMNERHLQDFGVSKLPAHLIINSHWEIVFRLEGSHSDPVAQLEPIIHRSINP